jgi:hypothetical protein
LGRIVTTEGRDGIENNLVSAFTLRCHNGFGCLDFEPLAQLFPFVGKNPRALTQDGVSDRGRIMAGKKRKNPESFAAIHMPGGQFLSGEKSVILAVEGSLRTTLF